MKRKANAFACAGGLMLVGGGYLFFSGPAHLPLWLTWLVGPFCWYVGFAMVTTWALLCLFDNGQRRRSEEENEVEVASNVLPQRQSEGGNVPVIKAASKLLLVLFLVIAGVPSFAADEPAALFKAKCAMCHGADGAGKTPMGTKFALRDLRAPEVQKQGDAELTQVISQGRNKMPAYEGKLTPEQIKALVVFTRDLAKTK